MEVKDTDVNINFTSWQGITDFSAYKFGSRKTAAANMSRWDADHFLQRQPAALRRVGQTSGCCCPLCLRRAKEIVQTGKLQEVEEEDGGVRKRTARCQGSDSGSYTTTATVSAAGDWADLTCTCPAAEKQALCKHCLALLLHGVPLPADEPAPQPAPPAQPPAAPAAAPAAGGRRRLPASMLQAPAAPAQ